MSESIDLLRGLILLLGGARAGKSSLALKLASEHERNSGGSVCFIATAQALDEEMSERILRHRDERARHWSTIEEPFHIDDALIRAQDAGVVIVDCLTLFVSNWLLKYSDEQQGENEMFRIISRFLELVKSRRQMVICVSNETGLGLVPDTPLGRVFRDALGSVNQRVAQAADEVYFLIAGLPVRLKPAEATNGT